MTFLREVQDAGFVTEAVLERSIDGEEASLLRAALAPFPGVHARAEEDVFPVVKVSPLGTTQSARCRNILAL